MTIVWKEHMSVSVPEFDAHHQKLFQIFNELILQMDQGMGKFVIYKTIDELMQYSQYHFDQEEIFMLQNACPDYLMHKKEHENFIKKISSMSDQCKANYSVNNVIELSMFLKDWIIDHILKVDKSYAKFYS